MNKLIRGLNLHFKNSNSKPLSYFKYIGDKIPNHEFTKSINLKNTNLIYSNKDYSISIVKLKKQEKGNIYKYKLGNSLFKPLIGNPTLVKYDKNMTELERTQLKKDEFNYVEPSHYYYQIINTSEYKNYFIQIYNPKIM